METDDAKKARAEFSYDPHRGVLTRTGGRFKGLESKATVRAGAIRIRFNGKIVALHRLIWLHVHGAWPSGDIDHINGDPKDNRLCNLRDVSTSVNMQNLRKATSRSKTGLLGAYPHRGAFIAQITVDGRIKSLGRFKTAQEAHEAYLQAKRRHHEGCTI